MAEILFQHEVEQHEKPIHVSSAGLNAMQDKPAHTKAQTLMREKGLDLSKHVAQQLNADLVSQSDLILVMTASQQKELEQKYPTARGRVFRLGHHEGFDVVDPYKRPDAIFDLSLAQIETGLNHWCSIILK